MRFFDEKGLAVYYGTVNLKSYGHIGGGAALWGPVRTVCRNRKYEEGLLTAFFAGCTVGVRPVGATVFSLEVRDHALPPGNLNSLGGFASIASASFIARSRTHLVLGSAEGDGWDWQLGFELGAIWMSGYSAVSMVHSKCCSNY